MLLLKTIQLKYSYYIFSEMKYIHRFLGPLFALCVWILNQMQKNVIMKCTRQNSQVIYLVTWRSLNILQIFYQRIFSKQEHLNFCWVPWCQDSKMQGKFMSQKLKYIKEIQSWRSQLKFLICFIYTFENHMDAPLLDLNESDKGEIPAYFSVISLAQEMFSFW